MRDNDQARARKPVCFAVGDRVRVRPEYRREDDFDEAEIYAIDEADGTIDVAVNGEDWGQWFEQLADGSYVIEVVPPAEVAGEGEPLSTREETVTLPATVMARLDYIIGEGMLAIAEERRAAIRFDDDEPQYAFTLEDLDAAEEAWSNRGTRPVVDTRGDKR